jgi:hypothetical protein
MNPLFWAFCIFGVIDLVFVGCTTIHVLKLVKGIEEGKIVLHATLENKTNVDSTNFEFIDTIGKK